MAAHLPQELLEVILGDVCDTATLHSCSIVTSSFRSPSQRLLFRKLWLFRKRSHQRPTLEDGSDFLLAHPHLAAYVRDVIVELSDAPPESAALAATLRSVTNLERLVVSGKSTKWSSLGDDAQIALLASLALPSLQILHLMNISGVPSAVLAAAVSIPVVSFLSVLINPREGSELYKRNLEFIITPRIRHLILAESASDGARHIFDFLLHPRDPPHTKEIKRLELRLESSGSETEARLLTACSDSLEHLTIDPGALLQTIDIPHLQMVRSMEIKIFVDQRRHISPHFSPTFRNIVSALPLVEEISLRFVVEPLHPEPEWEDPGPLPPFGPSFANRIELLHLRRVHCLLFTRSVLSSTNTLFSRFVAAIEARMPGLQGTGILRCSLAEPQARYIDRLP